METLVLGTYDEIARTTGRPKSFRQIIPFDDLVVEIDEAPTARGKKGKKKAKSEDPAPATPAPGGDAPGVPDGSPVRSENAENS